jgi:hypothetical protein
VLAQECHIIASSDEGPRADPMLPYEARDAYPNLVLLCSDHHKVVDDDAATWTPDRLQRMKKDHEVRVAEAMGAVDRRRLNDELVYAETVSAWVERARLEQWLAWTSNLLTPRPFIYDKDFEALKDLRQWLLSRPLPCRFEGLEAAFENFRWVAEDLAMVLGLSTSAWGQDRWMVDAFYKARHFEQAVYRRLGEQYEWLVDMIHDLTFELTRAANRISDEVRSTMDFRFRLEEGDVTVERQEELHFTRYVPRYSGEELDDPAPYRGLQDFSTRRAGREISCGTGVDEDALRRVTPIKLTR